MPDACASSALSRAGQELARIDEDEADGVRRMACARQNPAGIARM